MLQVVIVILIISILLAFIYIRRKRSNIEYLLGAGKNKFRLLKTHYDDPEALIIYAIWGFWNNSLEGYTEKGLESLNVKVRLSFLLSIYSDDTKPIDIRIKQLEDKFLKEKKKIPKGLQKQYKLSTNKENPFAPDLVKKVLKMFLHSQGYLDLMYLVLRRFNTNKLWNTAT